MKNKMKKQIEELINEESQYEKITTKNNNLKQFSVCVNCEKYNNRKCIDKKCPVKLMLLEAPGWISGWDNYITAKFTAQAAYVFAKLYE